MLAVDVTTAGGVVTLTAPLTPAAARLLVTAAGDASAVDTDCASDKVATATWTLTWALTTGVDADALVAPAAAAAAVARLAEERLLVTCTAAAVDAPRPETVIGTATSRRRRRPVAGVGVPAVTLAVAWTAVGRDAMTAALRDEVWTALSVVGPASVKVVATGRSVTITLTADAGTFAAAAMPAATLAAVKLAGLMPARERPTVVTLVPAFCGGGDRASSGGGASSGGALDDGGLDGGLGDIAGLGGVFAASGKTKAA